MAEFPGRGDAPRPAAPQPAQGKGWIIFLLVIGFILLTELFRAPGAQSRIAYSDFLGRLERGQVSEVTLTGDWIRGRLKGERGSPGERFETARVEDPELVDKLKARGVEFRGEPQNLFWVGMLSWIFPFLLLILFWRVLFGRVAGKAQSGFLSMGKSRAKIYVEKDVKTTFHDVAGVDEAKEELSEIVRFLREPERYSRLGGRIPKGILLIGPPGTGKTLMARAVAGESGVPFFSINGSEFVEMFVGLGAARVRDLFEQARKSAPCIVFIDELDALGKSRAFQGPTGNNDEKEQTLNQLLAELDGFDSTQGVILLAATNRPEILDPALLRAGRFDRQVLLDNPDRGGRLEILRIHSRKVKLGADADLGQIAALTPGFSGADLANLVNEAALVATRRNADSVSLPDFTQAIERIVAGLERRKRLLNPEERRRVAVHEMGHATLALALNTADRVHKVSIIPRSIGALGYTLQRPTEDRYLIGRRELMEKIAVLLGGRAAEQLFLHDVSTGAADDFAKATDIARAMVTRYGMSDRIGMASIERQSSPYLSGPLGGASISDASQRTLETVDHEVRSILAAAFELAERTLRRNHRFLEEGVGRLLGAETLDEREIKALWNMHGIPSHEDQLNPPVALHERIQDIHEKKAH